MDFLIQVVAETWYILKEASVFLLFGFALAGVLVVLVPARIMMRLLGAGRVKSVLWASAIGAPLPLCSCGVLPTALSLRRQGATKGATVSFLVSTPETGVDSISLSYALMDPIITIFRPVTAMVTAITAGLATNFFGDRKAGPAAVEERPAAATPSAGEPRHECCDAPDPTHAHVHHHPELAGTERRPREGVRQTVGNIYRYAFRDLLDEISYWLVLGIVLSGIIAATLPPDVFERYLTDPLTSMLVMLFIGILVYTCASSSTPIAAALVLKGLNPGAALVFLLAGPATSLGSITVLLKFLGARVVAIYLASIAVVSLLAGFTLNWTYQALAVDPRAIFGTGSAFIPEPVKVVGALVLLVLLVVSLRRTHVPGEWLWLRDRIGDLTGIVLTKSRLQVTAVAGLALLCVSTGLFTVQPGEVGIRLRFGQIVGPLLAPGLHYRLPWPLESHRIIERDLVRRAELGFRSVSAGDLTARTLARERLTVGGPSNPVPSSIKAMGYAFQKEGVPEEAFLLTGDGNLIEARLTVQYRVRDPIAYAYHIAEPEMLVRSLVLAAVRGAVAASIIDAVYTSARGALEAQVVQTVQQRLDRYGAGLEVLAVHLLYVHPPEEVHDAFRDVASAQEDRLRTINRAGTFAIEKVNEAEGEAAATIEQALAFRESTVLGAQGEAAAFGLKVGAYGHAPELTRFRLQLEAIEEILPGVQKVIRPGAEHVGDLDLWLLEPPAAEGDR